MVTHDQGVRARARTLRRLMGEIRTHDPGRSGDWLLDQLRAAVALRAEVDHVLDQVVVMARHRSPPVTWSAIGAAMGVSGSAASQRAHVRGLDVDPPDTRQHEPPPGRRRGHPW